MASRTILTRSVAAAKCAPSSSKGLLRPGSCSFSSSTHRDSFLSSLFGPKATPAPPITTPTAPPTTISHSASPLPASPLDAPARSSAPLGSGSPSANNTNAGAGTGTNTISADEIAHFSSLAAHWWDPKGEFVFLHRMNPSRIQFVRESIERVEELEQEGVPGGGQWLSGKRVLDVGCGGGIFAEVSDT